MPICRVQLFFLSLHQQSEVVDVNVKLVKSYLHFCTLPVKYFGHLGGEFFMKAVNVLREETQTDHPAPVDKPKGETHMGTAGTDSGCRRSGANSEIPDGRNIVGLMQGCCIERPTPSAYKHGFPPIRRNHALFSPSIRSIIYLYYRLYVSSEHLYASYHLVDL